MHIILSTNYSPWSPYSGGGQRSTHNLATALTKRGHHVDVIYTKSAFENITFPKDLPYDPHWALIPAIRSKRASWLRNGSIFFVKKKVRSLLQENTIIHSNGEEGALLSALNTLKKVCFVLTPRYPRIPDKVKNPTASTFRAFWDVRNTKYHLLGKALHGADVCCPTSRFTLEMLEEHYIFDQASRKIIPNGVDKSFLKAKYKTDFSGPLIFFGRLAYSKGVDTLIEALAIADQPQLKLLIVGRGEQKKELHRKVKELNLSKQISFKSWMLQEDLKKALEESSFAVLPSREESFGNTMAEAMATGTPVVSTKAGSIPEVIIDGETGLLVPPDDPQALSAAILSLYQDPKLALSLAQNAQKRVKNNYTWNAVAKAYEDVYKTII